MEGSGVRRAVVIALAAGCLAVGSLPVPAAAAGTHRISGTVSYADGPLTIASVALYRDDGSGTFTFYTYGDPDGSETFDFTVPDGRYKLRVTTTEYELFVNEWYDDQLTLDTATVVAVDGADVTLPDIYIARNPTITGRVVDETGAPLPGISVFAYPAHYLHSPDLTGTDSDGYFDIQVPPGDWTLVFRDDDEVYASEWLGDANSGESADSITVHPDEIASTGTTHMSTGGSISGTVKGPDGLPMRNYRVTATAGSSEPAQDWTDRDGRYVLPLLTPGDYAVRFDDNADNFVTEFYDDAADQASAIPVPVTEDDVTSAVDVQVVAIQHPVPAGVDLSGVVTDPAGHPVPGARVQAWDGRLNGTWEQVPLDDAVTDATGHYYLTGLDGLAVSTFKVWVSAGSGNFEDDDYLLKGQWYAGATGATAMEDALPVALLPGVPADADVPLPESGLLHGTTFTTGGTGYPGNADGSVVAEDQHGHWVTTAWIYSDFWQFYGGMSPGTYHLVPYGIGCSGGSLPIDVVVQSLQDTNVPGAAFCRPRVTVAPSVQGSPEVGQVLTVAPGEWSANSVLVGYEWLVDGTPVGTGPTYTVPPGDAGHQLAVRVTRRTDFACCSPLTGVATSAGVPVTSPPAPPPPGAEPRASSVAVTARVRRHAPRVTLRVAVAAGGAPVAGVVTVREGSRSLRTSEVRDGVVVLRLRGASPGRHTYTVAYAGTDGVLPDTATVTVRVRRAPAG